jgi:protein-S-isoprenylcysteine O-methyltransferase Ste14
MIKSRLAVSTVLSVIAYLGLAIVGAGGASRFFSYPPLIAVSVVTIALGVLGLFSEAHIGSGVREDRSNRWVVAALGVLGIIDAYLPAYTDRIDFLTFGGEGVRWLGFLLYTVGGILRLAPVFVLGRRFSGLVAIQPEHRLVTSGLYGIIRHPSYLGLFVLALGWGAGVPLRRRRSDRRADAYCRARSHPGGGAAAERELWRRIRRLQGPHFASRSVHLLSRPERRAFASARGLP